MKMESHADAGVDVARWVDLLIGVVPIVNLEWIQKIHSDVNLKGASQEAVVSTILQHMPDYLRYIIPQFSLTDINFQRIPTVDTSNPFIANDVPTADESMIVIRFREPKRHNFPNLLERLHNSFMSRPNTLVIPGGALKQALEIICSPLITELVDRRRHN
jgi:phosphoribulokinase